MSQSVGQSHSLTSSAAQQMYGRDCETDFIATHLYTCNAQYLQWRAACSPSASPACQLTFDSLHSSINAVQGYEMPFS